MEHTNAMTFMQAWTRILGQVEVFQEAMNNAGVTAIKGSCIITPDQPPSCDIDKLHGFAGDGYASLEAIPYGHHPVRISCVRADERMNTVISRVGDRQEVSMRQALGQILENVSSYIISTMLYPLDVNRNVTLCFDFDDEYRNEIHIRDEDGNLYFWEAPEEICTFKQLNAWLREETNEIRYHLTDLFVKIVQTRIDMINHDYPGLDLSACIQDKNIGIDYGIEFSFLYNGARINPYDMKDDDLEKIAPGLAMTLREIRTACRRTGEMIEIDKTVDRHIGSLPDTNTENSSEPDMNETELS